MWELLVSVPDNCLYFYSVQCIIVNLFRRYYCCLPQCDVILTSQYSMSKNEMLEVGGLF